MSTTPVPANDTWGLIRRFFRFYQPHRRLFAIDFGCAVLSGLLELAFPMAISAFIDDLLGEGDWGLITLASIALATIYLVNTFLMWVVTYWGHVLGIHIETELRRLSFDHLQKLSFSFFDNQQTGHLVGRVTKDLEEIGEVAHHGPEDVFIAVMTFLGAFGLMFYVNPNLALMTLIIVPLVGFCTVRFGARMTRTWRDLFRRVGDFNARIEANVGGIRVVKAFANEEYERTLFASDNANYGAVKREGYRTMAASHGVNYLGMRVTQLVVMVAGAWFVLQGDMTNGNFVSFLLLVQIFFRPIEKITGMIEIYPKGIAGFRRFEELLAIEPDIQDRPEAIDPGRLEGRIVYDNVSFGYSEERLVLKNISLTINPGETVAFVGPSGAGKTTITSLLPRFYEVLSGSITIDGIDIRDMKLDALRSEIGIVQQDVFLFPGTMRENIAYGNITASDDAILDAARRARLEEVIAVLPNGLDTVIGERGVKLSGGQKQRLAIARMFLKNPPILILDEATSALDTETERYIQQSLTDLSVGRTTLVIAHRLATIRNADRIVVVDHSGVVEEGPHDELVVAQGTYQRLYEAQYAGMYGGA